MTTTVLLRSGMTRNCHVPFWRAVEEVTPSLTLILMLFSQIKIPLEEGKSTPDQLVERLGMNRVTGSGQEALSTRSRT